MATPALTYGDGISPLLADPDPNTTPPPENRIFVLWNPGSPGRDGFPYVGAAPYIQSSGSAGPVDVEVWNELKFGANKKWVRNTQLGTSGVVTLDADGTNLLSFSGAPFSPFVFGVRTFVRIVTPNGVKGIAVGMTSNFE